MKKVMVERIVLDKDDREIKKSWGRDWTRMMAEIKKHGRVHILRGIWSGYRSEQSKLCHVEYIPTAHVQGLRLQRIVFTDGTTLDLNVTSYDLAGLFFYKAMRKAQYDELVYKARLSMEETYYVGGKQEMAQKIPDAVPQQEIQKTVLPSNSDYEGAKEKTESTAEKIKREQEGKNWYDKM